ncbi:MAG TPA: bifunctional phosphopantothenoylcysteine decarboxylase/phosphopantothenate--cysteine ligase CoaBC [Sedimenticola sp.]|nr:bifunctional phosphopantothenoylcysteine decarboxylase/phosphopantothenate--cysteine ligase CoaBC [Sedimenticola sp.]
MSGLKGRCILLGVTGGIAAYKSVALLRLLRREGADVQVVMTRAATEFVAPLTFQALSGRPVRQQLFDPSQEAAMGHIELARWADLVLVAPATAGFMARLAAGFADDLLGTLCLAAEAPVVLAPAMNRVMWDNPATRDNRRRLQAHGVRLWGPASGDQACGEQGPGRMLEPGELLSRVRAFTGGGRFRGVRVMITAGPTREAIDPVRFLSNRSSGKMGYALARAFAEQGAAVDLVSGPVALEVPPGVHCRRVESALEMRAAVLEQVAGCDIFVACAAVADYRPLHPATGKIKKRDASMDLVLTRNPDILAEVAALQPGPFTLGFAAETERPVEQGEQKRRAKGVDVIAANLVAGREGGFEREENALTLLWDGGRRRLGMMDKGRLADELVSWLAGIYETKG